MFLLNFDLQYIYIYIYVILFYHDKKHVQILELFLIADKEE